MVDAYATVRLCILAHQVVQPQYAPVRPSTPSTPQYTEFETARYESLGYRYHRWSTREVDSYATVHVCILAY